MARKRLQKLTNTMAQEAQRKHWETLGQLHAIKGLLAYMEGSCTYTLQHLTLRHIRSAQAEIGRAINQERENNEFINLNRKAPWQRRK